MTEIRVTNHLPEFERELVERTGLALKQAAEDIRLVAGMDVPVKSNELRQSGTSELVAPTHSRASYGTTSDTSDYAEYQERGMRADGSHRVRNYTKAGTGAHFLEKAGHKIGRNLKTYLKTAYARIKV